MTLEPLAWARTDGGAWRAHPLRTAAGHARGAPWTLPRSEEDELREFLDLLAVSKQSGRIAWALARFMMGCSRAARHRGPVRLRDGAARACSTAPTRRAGRR